MVEHAKVIASCGHAVADVDGMTTVWLRDVSLFPDGNGLSNAVREASFCHPCARAAARRWDWLDTSEEARAWMDGNALPTALDELRAAKESLGSLRALLMMTDPAEHGGLKDAAARRADADFRAIEDALELLEERLA